jgi:hypothetical protein
VPLAHRYSNVAVNAKMDALAPLLNNGYLRLYDGLQPTTPDTAIGKQRLLAELRFGMPAFGAAVAGVITATEITQDSAAAATGTATWYRAFKSDGRTAIHDGSVGTVGSNINLNSALIEARAIVAISDFTLTDAKVG